MKKITFILTLVFFLSCNQQESTNSLSNEDIKSDLAELSIIIPIIEAGLEVTSGQSASEVEDLLNENRAFSPISVSSDADQVMTEYFGEEWGTAPNAPSEIFSNKAAEVSGVELRIPASGYIYGLEGDATLEFYLVLEQISSVKYRVYLYKYPGDIFNIDYIYEEYIVDESHPDSIASWAWQWFDSRGNLNKYSQNITYYRDGTYSERDISWISYDSMLDLVKSGSPGDGTEEPLNYSINDMILDIDDYIYPDVEPIYTDDTSSGTFSSISDFLVAGTKNRLSGSEFYTEDETNSYSVLYMEGKKRKDLRKNVTRYIKNRSLNETNILSMNTEGDNYTEINRVRKSSNSYLSWRHIWYTAPSTSLDTNTATSYITVLEKETGSSIYSGTQEIYYGSDGEKYNYSVDSSTGEVTMIWLESISRSLGNLTINLTDLRNITIDSGNWVFTGEYEMGELYGTYSYMGDGYAVVLELQGIEINGVFENW